MAGRINVANIGAKVRGAIESSLGDFAEDAVKRVQSLVPVMTGHLRLTTTKSDKIDLPDGPRYEVGVNATAGGKKIGKSSKRSPEEPETIEPRRPTFGGIAFINYGLIVHELMAWSKGPPGLSKNEFQIGRSDKSSGGHTLDEPQAATAEPTDGDRGGMFLTRVVLNTEANSRRFLALLKFRIAKIQAQIDQQGPPPALPPA